MCIDDSIIKGRTISEVREGTLLAIKRLHESGFKIDLNKMMLLTTSVEIVGYHLTRHVYMVGEKAISQLMKASIPRNYHEVM